MPTPSLRPFFFASLVLLFTLTSGTVGAKAPDMTMARGWTQTWVPVEAESHFMVTSCSQVLPGGRSVFRTNLATDPDQACDNLNSGSNVHMNCADHSASSLGATGTVETETAKGVRLWTCVVHEVSRGLSARAPTVSDRRMVPEHNGEGRGE